jgi:hypothetical protein
MPVPLSGRKAGGACGLAVRDGGRAVQVDRVEQDSVDVDQVDGERRRDLRHDLGFADAGGAPEEGGLLDLRQHLQRGCDFGRFHAGLHDGRPRSLSRCHLSWPSLGPLPLAAAVMRDAGRGGSGAGTVALAMLVEVAAKPPICFSVHRDGFGS